MALLDVYSRLKRLLEDRSEPQADGTRSFAERLTHQAIASEIGCSREMVSRLLKDLESGGYVTGGRGQLIIRNALPSRW
jgi:CRP/FNR family cyclic AMP-dependent transcriptional regulator